VSEAKLREYALRPVGTARIRDNIFVIEIIDHEIFAQSRCLYAFLVDDEIVRVGSTQNRLRVRMRQWERDVSRALQGLKSPTRQEEAKAWRELLHGDKYARIFARMGTVAYTGVGPLNTFRIEEEALIGEFQPRLCWDRARYKGSRISN
jgi:hypothetical protein